MTAAASHRWPAAGWLVPLLLACAALAPSTASPLEAQPCSGFSGQGFLGASGAIRREWSENMTGIGGAGGFRVGPVAATAHYLKFSGADEYDQEFDFESARVNVAYEFHTNSLSLCPVLTSGLEGISSRKFSFFPYKSKPFFGGGLALGRQFTAPDSGVTIIPSLTVSIESHVVERIIEGDISINQRETNALLHGGVTVEFGRVFLRPYAALIAVDDGWLTGGARFGVTF